MAEPSVDIIRRAQAGEPDALTQLILSQQHYVYSIAMGVLKNPEDAADLTQDAFVRLVRALPQYTGESRFTTWLYRLVVNECLDTARRRKSAVWNTDRARLEEFAAPGSQEEDYARGQMAGSVRAAVSALPSKFRIAVLLRYFDDLSYEQMAQVLHCSMGTVASRLSRGHKILGERLKNLMGTKG